VALSLAREPRFANTSEKALGSKGASLTMRGIAHFYALMACPGTSIEIASTTFCRIAEDDEWIPPGIFIHCGHSSPFDMAYEADGRG
jgi:hypothetical protein